eukprot:Clim_evm36s119 gene=Clim_evmTU36s119
MAGSLEVPEHEHNDSYHSYVQDDNTVQNSIGYGDHSFASIPDLARKRKSSSTRTGRSRQSSTSHDIEAVETTSLLGKPKRQPGHSSVAQVTYNACNVLMGAGLLSVPFAFKGAGWIAGIAIFLVISLLTNMTGKLLYWSMVKNEHVQDYPGLGQVAFGSMGSYIVGGVFFFDIFCASVMFIILIADSLYALYDGLSPLQYVLIQMVVLIPMTWTKRLSLMAYLSFLGLLSVAALAGGLFIKAAEVNLAHHPANTTLGPQSFQGILACYGMILMQYGGHAIMPSLAASLKDFNHFPRVLNITYAFCVAIGLSVGVIGFAIYGQHTEKEITLNLLEDDEKTTGTGVTGYLGPFVLLLVVVNAVTKYPLLLNVASMYIDQIVCLCLPPSFDEDGTTQNRILHVTVRTVVGVLTFGTAILIPSFAKLTAFIGAGFQTFLCLVFPVYVYKVSYQKEMSPFTRFVMEACVFMSIIAGCFGVYGAMTLED